MPARARDYEHEAESEAENESGQQRGNPAIGSRQG